MTIWRMRIASRIPKAVALGIRLAISITYSECVSVDTHSEYVMFIAFPLQQLLHERVSMLCYTHIARVIIRICGTNAKG